MSTARRPIARPHAARTDAAPPDASAVEDASDTRRRRHGALHPRGGRRLLAPLAGLAATAALLAGCGGTEAPAEDTGSASSEESSAESTDEGGDGSATAEQTSDGDAADDTAVADDDGDAADDDGTGDGTDDDSTDGDDADASTDDAEDPDSTDDSDGTDDAGGGGEVNLFEGTWGIGHDEKALDAEQLADLLEEQAEALGPPEMSLDVECEDGVDTAVQDYEAACIAYADEGVEHPWAITAGPADGGLEIEVANED